MQDRRIFVLTTLLALASIQACASASTGGPATTRAAEAPVATSNPNLISAADLAAARLDGSAYDLIRRLRPSWMTGRGTTSYGGSGGTLLSFDGGQLEALDALQQLSATAMKEARLLSVTDAAQKFGTSANGSRVIVVMRK